MTEETMKYGLILLTLIATPCWSQTTATGQAETKGPCSPAVTGNNNQFEITCEGISKEQGAEFLKILNKISRNQLDPKAVMDKLDEIQRGIQDIKGWPELDQGNLNKTFQDSIGKFPPQSVLIDANDANADSSRLVLATQLKKAFASVGWTDIYILNPMTFLYEPQTGTPVIPQGLELLVKERTPAADALGAALLQIFGKGLRGQINPSLKTVTGATIQINIWQKPKDISTQQ
jgi:hypothetical protein